MGVIGLWITPTARVAVPFITVSTFVAFIGFVPNLLFQHPEHLSYVRNPVRYITGCDQKQFPVNGFDNTLYFLAHGLKCKSYRNVNFQFCVYYQ